MTVSKCRGCGIPKMAKDPCSNPDCLRASGRLAIRLNNHHAISATSPHGFHAPTPVGPWVHQYAKGRGK